MAVHIRSEPTRKWGSSNRSCKCATVDPYKPQYARFEINGQIFLNYGEYLPAWIGLGFRASVFEANVGAVGACRTDWRRSSAVKSAWKSCNLPWIRLSVKDAEAKRPIRKTSDQNRELDRRTRERNRFVRSQHAVPHAEANSHHPHIQLCPTGKGGRGEGGY